MNVDHLQNRYYTIQNLWGISTEILYIPVAQGAIKLEDNKVESPKKIDAGTDRVRFLCCKNVLPGMRKAIFFALIHLTLSVWEWTQNAFSDLEKPSGMSFQGSSALQEGCKSKNQCLQILIKYSFCCFKWRITLEKVQNWSLYSFKSTYWNRGSVRNLN